MNWWQDFYDDFYADMALVGEADETQAIMDQLMALLKIEAPVRWFDQCCGVGRWSFALAQRGHAVEGVDLMPGYIQRATAQADALGLGHLCTFAADDALTYQVKASCDVAMNWYTSFGYFEQDTHNLTMLKRAFDALKPGGIFVLECGNAARIIHQFIPSMTYRQPDQHGDELFIVRESSLDLTTSMMHQRWSFIAETSPIRVHDTAIKLYMPAQLTSMIEQAGFEQIQAFGGVDGQPLTLESTRCLIVAKKPDTVDAPVQ